MTPAAETALAGRRVLELADASGAYCGKLLADLGADVIKVEPPGGDSSRRLPPFVADRPGDDRGLFFLYMNTNKRGIVLDLETAPDRERLRRLAAGADLVIETLAPGRLDAWGLGYADLAADNPALVMTSISGFGATGPDRLLPWNDLIAGARSGAAYVTGEAEDPPVVLAGAQSYVMASTCAAAGSLIALHHSRATGRGQHVDVSTLETLVAVSHVCGVGKWLDDGIVPVRSGTGLFASVPSGAYRCRDGLVYLMVNRPLHWQALAEWIHEETGNREVLDPMFQGPSSNRLPYRELLDLFIAELVSKHSVEHVYREGQRRHIAFTPVNSARDVVEDAHLAARGYFVSSHHPVAGPLRMPGAPYRHSATPWRIARPAPQLSQHTAEVLAEPGRAARRVPAAAPSDAARGGALAGVKVLEFTAGMAGPWIGRFMAWCGADVIKVESAKHPSVVRLYVPPGRPEAGTQPELSPWFTDWDAGKRFVAIDLRKPDGVALARRLAKWSDVVIENHAAGVMERLGLGFDELRRDHPSLVAFATSGYGDSGPDRSFVTWGPNIEALSGLSVLSGFAERPCTITQYAYPDALSALHGLVAVMAALDHRARTGSGQSINLSQLEATVSCIGHVMMEALVSGREPRKLANGSPVAAPHGCYPCRGDDRWCALAVEDDAGWQRFTAALGEPEWALAPGLASASGRLAHAAEIDARVSEWTAAREAEAVVDALRAAQIAACVVQNVADLVERDAQLRARRFFETVEHRIAGPVVATGIPLGLTGTPGRTPRAGGAIGQDNEAVFRGLLGLSRDEYDAHVAAGAIEVDTTPR